jgi:hypothetical protein
MIDGSIFFSLVRLVMGYGAIIPCIIHNPDEEKEIAFTFTSLKPPAIKKNNILYLLITKPLKTTRVDVDSRRFFLFWGHRK